MYTKLLRCCLDTTEAIIISDTDTDRQLPGPSTLPPKQRRTRTQTKKRQPCLCQFEFGKDDDGEVRHLGQDCPRKYKWSFFVFLSPRCPRLYLSVLFLPNNLAYAFLTVSDARSAINYCSLCTYNISSESCSFIHLLITGFGIQIAGPGAFSKRHLAQPLQCT